MTDLTQYEKGCSPCAIQRKYGLTYAKGYELAERLRKTQELELENKKLKELLKDCQEKILLMDYDSIKIEILQKINEVLK